MKTASVYLALVAGPVLVGGKIGAGVVWLAMSFVLWHVRIVESTVMGGCDG